jgi:pimeloyl-ACP methyl ester carboxylesterase
MTVRRVGLTFDVATGGPADGEPVLLLHGFPQTAVMWDTVAAGLQRRGYRTVAPNQRGYSAGARPGGTRAYRLGELAGDAAAVVEQAAGGPVHVVGHDWGGPVAWILASLRPELVLTLTTISGPHPGAYLRAARRTPQALASWYIPLFQVPGLAERILDPDTDAGRRRLVRLLRLSGHEAAHAERDVALLGRDGLAAGLAWYRAMALRPSRRLLEATTAAPALLLWGDRDTAVRRPAIEMSAAYAAGPCRVEVLPGVTYWAPDQAADRLVPLIADHLAAHPSGTVTR